MLTLLLMMLAPLSASAFPEMVRNHYVNCNSCHVSPNGGGILTPYGRGMSAEVLSTWSYENEALFSHGLLKPDKMPKFLNLGGDVRALEKVQKAAPSAGGTRKGEFILMQAQVEAAVTAGPLTAVAAFGEVGEGNEILGKFPRFYLMANATDTLQFRAGRFLPAFGINLPQHIYPTRGPLGFGFDDVRNTVEANWSDEQWHAALSASEGLPDHRTGDRERGAAFQLEKFIQDSYRVGFSLWDGVTDHQERWVTSVHGILGFRDDLYLLSELAWQSRQAKTAGAARENGLYQFNRFGYEIKKGLHLLAVEQYSQSDLKKVSTERLSFGLGAVWYPRPHFEFELTLNERRIRSRGLGFGDYSYLMAHYYL